MSSYVCSGNAPRLAQIALTHRLYDPHGTLKDHLRALLKFPDSHMVALFYWEESPVGVATCNRRGLLSVYVHPDHRGRGYGARLIDVAMVMAGHTRYTAFALRGQNSEGSRRFWAKSRIYMPGQYRSWLRKNPARNYPTTQQWIATWRVEGMRAQGISHHYHVDEHLIHSGQTVEGYTPRTTELASSKDLTSTGS